MSLYGVIGYHVTLSEGHVIANHPIYGGEWLSCDPLRGSHNSHDSIVATLIYLSQIYSYYIRGDRSPLINTGLVYIHILHNTVTQHYS